MSSSPLQSPFLDPDVNQPLPPIPPRSKSRPSTPLHASSSLSPVSKNPFIDPANVISARQKAWSNNAYHVSVTMNGAGDEGNSTANKSTSAKSPKSGKSSMVSGTTTLIPNTPPFAPSFPPGHDINKPSTSTYTITNPFADPPDPIPESFKPTPNTPNTSTQTLPTLTTSTHVFATTTSTPGLSRTLEHIQNASTKLRRSPLEGEAKRGKHYLSKEAKLRQTAHHQNYLLELERRKTVANIYPDIPHLHSSPRIQGSLHRDVSSGSGSGLIVGADAKDTVRGRWELAKNPWFWMFFAMIQIGLISTGAAFAVLLRDRGAGESIKIGTGMVFWLVCSIVCALIGIIGSLCIWGSRNTCCLEMLSRAGLNEMGLLPNYGRSESQVAAGFREREEEDARMLARLERVRERERERMRFGGRENSMSSIKTIDPLWQVLYATPEELRKKISWEVKGDEGAMEMKIRGGRLRTQRSVGAESMLSGGSELRNFNELDIGVQKLYPTPLPSSNNDFHHQRPRAKDDRFPFSKFHANTTERQKHYNDRQKHNPRLHTDYVRNNNHSSSAASTSLVSPLSSSSPSTQTYTTSSSRSPSVNPNNDTTTALQTFSPLENLARELNAPKLRSLSAKDRHGYIIERRSENEERGRKVRQSLERQTTGSLEHKPTVSRRALKPIVQERVQSIERRSRSRGNGGERVELGAVGKGEVNGDGGMSGGEGVKVVPPGVRAKKAMKAANEQFTENHGRSLEVVLGKKNQGSPKVEKRSEPQPGSRVFIVGEE